MATYYIGLTLPGQKPVDRFYLPGQIMEFWTDEALPAFVQYCRECPKHVETTRLENGWLQMTPEGCPVALFVPPGDWLEVPGQIKTDDLPRAFAVLALGEEPEATAGPETSRLN